MSNQQISVESVLFKNYKLWCFSNDHFTKFIKTRKSWQNELTQLYENHINKNHTVIDIGAYVGLHAIQLSKKAKRVYAFEPAKHIYTLLEKNLIENNIDNVITSYIGLSDKYESLLSVYMPAKSSNIYSTSLIQYPDSVQIGNSVVLQPLDNFMNIFTEDHIAMILIDTTGYDYKILIGAQNIINKYKPIVIINTPLDIENDEKLNFLKLLQYKCIPFFCKFIVYYNFN